MKEELKIWKNPCINGLVDLWHNSKGSQWIKWKAGKEYRNKEIVF